LSVNAAAALVTAAPRTPPLGRLSGSVLPLLRRRPRVLFVAPEMADFVQVGGLGAVASSLPRAMKAHADIRVLLPGYRGVLARASALDIVAQLPGAGAIPPCSIGRAALADAMHVYIVLCAELYDRDGELYVGPDGRDWPDNDLRFARLSLAAAQIATGECADWRPEALHLNDWQSALAAGYSFWSGQRTPAVLTIHNLAHQGLFDASRRAALAIPEAAFGIDGVEFHGKISFLKGGINFASRVTTVSEVYAGEVTTQALGCGLDGLMAKCARDGRLAGILNGIDESWDPRNDPRCPFNYDANRWKGRYADYVRGAFGLSLARAPLFAVVSRFVQQKGVDLVLRAAETIVRLGGQLVAVGRGEPQFEKAFRNLSARARDAVGVRIGFEAEEARAIFAGADFLLMPSRFEPCGLSQMYAQRFGAIPLAARTGGLVETIEDGKTGFLFDPGDEAQFIAAIKTAFEIYASPKRLSDLRRSAMAKRFDWTESARLYAALYRDVIEASV